MLYKKRGNKDENNRKVMFGLLGHNLKQEKYTYEMRESLQKYRGKTGKERGKLKRGNVKMERNGNFVKFFL